ncbi:nuclear transport factor 2 family protein [Spirosoma koreense]
MTNQQIIRHAYQAFNARNIDGVLTVLHSNVQWPRAWEGDHVTGHDAVRTYWTQQWQEIDPSVTPVDIQEKPNGQIEVTVHQLVKDRQGQILADELTRHLYTIDDGKIVRMDIGKA